MSYGRRGINGNRCSLILQARASERLYTTPWRCVPGCLGLPGLASAFSEFSANFLSERRGVAKYRPSRAYRPLAGSVKAEGCRYRRRSRILQLIFTITTTMCNINGHSPRGRRERSAIRETFLPPPRKMFDSERGKRPRTSNIRAFLLFAKAVRNGDARAKQVARVRGARGCRFFSKPK